ncbi:MAG: hypothetical protein CL489_01855 [Acidobacteria bacterium]|nr:hypothetical protein [Acidobacteriota bacterium]|tara:strand:- start:948 stop:1556 length:609 start_codon:yes stop_codon:yes gene_type:complete
MSEVLKKLSEPFDKRVESHLNKGGTTLTYIKVSEVISRLNDVLGVDGWSLVVKECRRDAVTPDWIIAHVTLTTIIDGAVVHKDGFGGQEVKYMKNGNPVDLGNEFKGAVSDATKKAAQSLGVGLYLARVGVSKEDWANFRSVADSLTEEQRTKLSEFWTEHSGGQEKPTEGTATMEDLIALSDEAVRLSFNATVVEDDEESS